LLGSIECASLSALLERTAGITQVGLGSQTVRCGTVAFKTLRCVIEVASMFASVKAITVKFLVNVFKVVHHDYSFAFPDMSVMPRDVVLTKKVWKRIQKMAILIQPKTHFKAKREKGVETPFPRVPAPLHPWSCHIVRETYPWVVRISST